MESNYRSLAKAISYRILGSAATALIVFILSRKPLLSLGTGALDMATKIGLYYLHERIWERIPLGRPKPPEYQI
jgi:adenylylsulfate kinase